MGQSAIGYVIWGLGVLFVLITAIVSVGWGQALIGAAVIAGISLLVGVGGGTKAGLGSMIGLLLVVSTAVFVDFAVKDPDARPAYALIVATFWFIALFFMSRPGA
jgi:hypothetical protein